METYLTMLTDRGYDVEVNALEDGERITRTVVSTTKEAPIESKPIGRIDYIDTGVVPKYAGCVNGVQWFKDRGQWIDGSAEPVPGMIIFFDWDNKGSSGPQDGQSDHTGIVQKVENGIVYTVEGNSGDSCRVNQYSIGHYEILGYGVPNY